MSHIKFLEKIDSNCEPSKDQFRVLYELSYIR